VNAKNVGGTSQSAVDIAARIGAPAGASVSADVAAVKVDTAAVKVQTDKLAFTVTNQVDANVLDWKSATAPAMTGDAFARLGAPAGASVSADVAATKALLPTALVGGKMDSHVNDIAAGAITATSIGADAITDAKVASDVTIASVTGAVGSVTGAVGSVTGAVGSVTGLTASDVGAIKAKTDNLPSDPADASDIAGAFSTVNSTLGTIAGYIDTEVGAIKAKTDNLPASPAAVSDIPTAAAVSDAVWDEVLSGHTTPGTAGKALSDAGTAGDPWTTLLPGSYGAGTAGKIVGDKLPSLTFTVPGKVDSNVKAVNDTTVIGDGQLGTEWGPA
jgi:hypothetical protein